MSTPNAVVQIINTDELVTATGGGSISGHHSAVHHVYGHHILPIVPIVPIHRGPSLMQTLTTCAMAKMCMG